MKIDNLRELLIHELKDLYSAETQLSEALPKMARAAHSPRLKEAFEEHLAQTEVHRERLEEVAALLDDSSLKGKRCKAMEGLIAEGAEIIKEKAVPIVRDAALIGSAQKVEHYEIAGYGTARTFAEVLGETEVAALLDLTAQEEGATDKLLTEIALTINEEAEEPASA